MSCAWDNVILDFLWHVCCYSSDGHRHSFPVMYAGGSPFPHRGSIDPIGMGSMILVGRGMFGPSLLIPVCPIEGRTFPGLTFMGGASGNGIIPLAGSSGAVWSHLHCFLEPLLGVHSAVSVSESDSHSCHLHENGDALHFPNDLTSFWRLLSSVLSLDCFVSTLQQQSFSEEFLL